MRRWLLAGPSAFQQTLQQHCIHWLHSRVYAAQSAPHTSASDSRPHVLLVPWYSSDSWSLGLLIPLSESLQVPWSQWLCLHAGLNWTKLIISFSSGVGLLTLSPFICSWETWIIQLWNLNSCHIIQVARSKSDYRVYMQVYSPVIVGLR